MTYRISPQQARAMESVEATGNFHVDVNIRTKASLVYGGLVDGVRPAPIGLPLHLTDAGRAELDAYRNRGAL